MLNAILDIGMTNCFLMVPLTTKVRYRGFVCLVEAFYPFEVGKIVHGRRETEFVQLGTVKDSLREIGKYLNLKPHSVKGRTSSDTMAGEVYLSQNLKLYRIQKLSLEDLIIEKNQKISQDFEKLKMVKTTSKNPDSVVYYMTKTESIFPVDFVTESSSKLGFVLRNRLRPEFMKNYEKKLNPDNFIDLGGSKQNDHNDIDLAEAHKVLVTKKLKNVINDLDSYEFVPMSPEGLEKLLKYHGVNSRYIGYIIFT